ncbi:nucleotidyltransferase domain-containing protein [Candidatus Pacearchaeota archaeon]|nr:nucleotidyltransferase domain-containing protein [Candidatus Pacearchaeota archaeon]
MIKAYASYFASYILSNTKNPDNLLKIILFGSVAKGEAIKESDVDIFIELKKKNKKTEKELEKLTEDFYKSREALIFNNKGINNKINIMTGKLKEWKNLKKSIESTGVLLYGKYIPTEIKGKRQIIFFWDKIKNNRGAFLNKVYGFKVKDKKYKGLLEIYDGKKLGKSCIMIPLEHKEEIMNLLKYYGVNAKIIEGYFED